MSDLIERDKAIDTLQMDISIIPYVKAREYANAVIETIYNRLKQLSPAQPEITDKQAIEHLRDTGWMQNHDHEMYMMGIRDALADDSGSYDALIPAEYKLDEWCTDCKEYDSEAHCCPRFNRVIRTAMGDAQPEQKVGKWILYEKSKGFPDWHCSVCNGSGRGDYRICPWCGAKMEE